MTWGYPTKAEREARDAHILELWQMGYDRDQIARWVDLTPQRVSQIVANFGCTFR